MSKNCVGRSVFVELDGFILHKKKIIRKKTKNHQNYSNCDEDIDNNNLKIALVEFHVNFNSINFNSVFYG